MRDRARIGSTAVLAAALLLLGPRNVPGAPQDVLEGFARSSGPGPARTIDRAPVEYRGRFSGYTNYWQTAAWSWAQHGKIGRAHV